jgi:hypothetical protein
MLQQGKSCAMRAVWLVLVAMFGLSTSAAYAAVDSHGMPTPRLWAGRLPGKPAYLWLWYATGGPMPEFSEYCGDLTPPPYQCKFGSNLEDCQRQVQAFLDDWYKDFNLVFTLTRPPSGDYYTIIITSGWDQCKNSSPTQVGVMPRDEAGLAPGNCNDNPGQTALAIECGTNAHDCATIIAHEHGHLVGLEHTASRMDIMNAKVLPTAAGFEDWSNPTDGDVCDLLVQNSYQQMLSALGPWPGGTKPALPFSASDAGTSDAVSPDAGASDAPSPDTAEAPATGTVIGPGQGGTIDGSVTVLPGFDAISRPPPPTADAAPPTPSPSSQHGGCDMADAPAPPSLVLVAGVLLVCALRSRARAAALSRAAASTRHGSPRGP